MVYFVFNTTCQKVNRIFLFLFVGELIVSAHELGVSVS